MTLLGNPKGFTERVLLEVDLDGSVEFAKGGRNEG